MRLFKCFLRDEVGAINTDFVALSSGLLLLGIAVIYAIYGNGVFDTVSNVNTTLRSGSSQIETGTPPDFTQ